jgi:nucleoside-diphosphate-sugar epimerase
MAISSVNRSKKVNILISGATGFLGSHLVRVLAKEGHRCKCLVRRTSSTSELKDLDHVEFVYGDITDKESLKEAVKDVRVIYHLAAQIGKWGIPEKTFFAVNVRGTRNLLEVAHEGEVKQFIFCSTPGVQGKGYAQASETLPYKPPYIYELTKCEGEKLVLGFHQKRKDLSVTILRPDFVYGPGDLRRLPLYRAIGNKRFYLIGNGRALLHPTYIEDVVQGFCLTANNHVSFGEIYNIAGPRAITVREYAETIAQTLNVSFPRLRFPKPFADILAKFFEVFSRITGKEPILSQSKVKFLTSDHGSNISKAMNRLGYRPETDFAVGIKRTVDWYSRQDLL